MRKDKKNYHEIVKKLLLILLAALTLYSLYCFYYDVSTLNPPIPVQCVFQAGITCIANDLNENGELDLTIGQGLGHIINITGVACTQSQTQPSYINNYASDSILINSGQAKDVSKLGTSHVVMCTDASGVALLNSANGVFSYGYVPKSVKIYINYTEVDTGVQRVAVGRDSFRIRAPCWEESPCACFGANGCFLLPLLIIIWLVLGGYFFSRHKKA